ncbi:hypothetical protein BY996DRAFT_6556059 [Phakopsora pachyrhizi]|nr:hypothetical protein BY996DRAFT_6470690 [Phakopsora pachyrhizi]KAI8450522.1 hypothetical protein BY996DRAFT_6556059 [Phakopsora pachyrhizi]
MALTVWRLSGGDILGGTSDIAATEPVGRPRFTVFTPLSHNRMQQSEGEIDEEIPFRIQLV